MGRSASLAKTLLIPAVISLAVYLILSYAIIPFIRHSRQRYAQYLPLHTISAHTSTLRERVSDALMNFVLPSAWRRRQVVEVQDDDDSVFDAEQGEGMVGFDIDASRREALDRQRGLIIDTDTRLSRDLEEGFMDDSEDEDGTGRPRRS
ncbi:hypothetical protein AJ80_07408 [Polytolypa hystricis UAMH7299]|uniref:Uncharacterized protein n=1 Tax=Polytolypa hystricis (strain UAMH7299) TaxID=1447883 RepID=A0A2B7XQ72_POLH7|nr:hypothetical protein AJ80_07408 [Polytolypa hystricis UAMH7299]